MRLAKLRSGIVPLFALLALGVGMAGCSGDDGKDGTNGTNGTNGAPGATGPTGPAGGVGPTGPTGPAGPGAKVTPLESCNVCHSDGDMFAAANAHALSNIPSVSGLAFAVVNGGADLQVKFNLKLDGVAAANFVKVATRTSGGVTTARAYKNDGARTQFALADVGFSNDGGGAYTITIKNAGTTASTNARYLFQVQTADVPAVSAIVSGDYPAAPRTDLVSDTACQNCHGPTGSPSGIHYSYPMGIAQCATCHDATNTTYPEPVLLGHSVHNSHQMPAGEWEEFGIRVTYPTYMTNCSVCHDSPSTLAAANAMPVSGTGCLSCHGSMESWAADFEETGTTFHLAYTTATDCASCHNANADAAAPGLVDVRDFHDGLETERVGIIYGGEDLSVTEGKKFKWWITKVVDNKTTGKLEVSWKAEYPVGTSVNPCNSTATATAPVFFNLASFPANEGGLSIIRSYAIGDDYVVGTSTSSPGQPGSVSLTSDSTKNGYTSCASNEATTFITRDAKADGTRAILALQGKPLLPVPAGMTTEHWPYSTMYIRVPTPTYEFAVGTGNAVTPRRAIADTSACLKCHVGSLYQHGNTRVDNVTMCILCHNSASSDQNNRVTMGVTASEAYDGKVGQTYEFKTFLHKLHKSGRAGSEPIVIYRTRGIFAWIPEGSSLPNWAGQSCGVASPIAPATTPAPYVILNPTTPPAGMSFSTLGYIVYGASTNADGSYPTVACQTHNLYEPTYPRPENDCLACHKAGFDQVPDQDKAVATTLDAGAAPWNNQVDDVLQGAGAAGCTSCHQDSAAKGHAYQNGWVPTTFDNGRQTIVDEANK